MYIKCSLDYVNLMCTGIKIWIIFRPMNLNFIYGHNNNVFRDLVVVMWLPITWTNMWLWEALLNAYKVDLLILLAADQVSDQSHKRLQLQRSYHLCSETQNYMVRHSTTLYDCTILCLSEFLCNGFVYGLTSLSCGLWNYSTSYAAAREIASWQYVQYLIVMDTHIARGMVGFLSHSLKLLLYLSRNSWKLLF